MAPDYLLFHQCMLISRKNGTRTEVMVFTSHVTFLRHMSSMYLACSSLTDDTRNSEIRRSLLLPFPKLGRGPRQMWSFPRMVAASAGDWLHFHFTLDREPIVPKHSPPGKHTLSPPARYVALSA